MKPVRVHGTIAEVRSWAGHEPDQDDGINEEPSPTYDTPTVRRGMRSDGGPAPCNNSVRFAMVLPFGLEVGDQNLLATASGFVAEEPIKRPNAAYKAIREARMKREWTRLYVSLMKLVLVYVSLYVLIHYGDQLMLTA